MKSIVFIISFILFSGSNYKIHAQKNGLTQLREICYTAFLEENPSGINEKIEQNKQVKIPLANAYKGIVFMLEAKKSFSPYHKIKYFNMGKNLLENSIISDRSCIELRFLRYCVQTNLPFFLCYSGSIKNDKDYIILNWPSLTDADLKERIKSGMINSLHCSEAEKGKFKDGRNAYSRR